MFERDRVTLDFDGSTIRYLLVQSNAAAQWDEVTLPAEAMQHGLVRDPAAAGASLTDLFDRHPARRPRVTAAVTGHRAISRQLTLPPMRDRLLPDAIRHRVRQDFPLPIDQTDLTWHVLHRSDEAIEVYVLAVPREAVDGLVESVKSAGHRLRSMDLRPLALARLAADPTALLVNLEEHSLTILVTHNGVPAVVRKVPFTTIRPGAEARLEALLQELSRTEKFYNEGHREAPLDRHTPMVATGELLQRDDLLEALRRQHGGAVSHPDSSLACPPDLPRATFAVNLGLAQKKA